MAGRVRLLDDTRAGVTKKAFFDASIRHVAGALEGMSRLPFQGTASLPDSRPQ